MSNENEQLTLGTLRKRVGLTQRKLADALGITIKTISAWERGVVEPRMTFAETQQYMDILQCSFQELLEATSKRAEN
ncbi:MAG: helix-turn-helix transcriptional regulator [Prochloraceae cyanobacterium]|nr:helix-turn-helix transcriptional regulator [Prochloraceae cyanobacterium]